MTIKTEPTNTFVTDEELNSLCPSQRQRCVLTVAQYATVVRLLDKVTEALNSRAAPLVVPVKSASKAKEKENKIIATAVANGLGNKISPTRHLNQSEFTLYRYFYVVARMLKILTAKFEQDDWFCSQPFMAFLPSSTVVLLLCRDHLRLAAMPCIPFEDKIRLAYWTQHSIRSYAWQVRNNSKKN